MRVRLWSLTALPSVSKPKRQDRQTDRQLCGCVRHMSVGVPICCRATLLWLASLIDLVVLPLVKIISQVTPADQLNGQSKARREHIRFHPSLHPPSLAACLFGPSVELCRVSVCGWLARSFRCQ